MKNAVAPLLMILAAIIVLAVAGYLYDQRFGAEGPFQSQHGHGPPGTPGADGGENLGGHHDHHHHDHSGDHHE